MTRIPVLPHLTADEIVRQYRSCADAAVAGGLTPSWGRTLIERWNVYGPADGPDGNGAEPLLTPDRQAELYQALRADPPDGGLWTGPKVARSVRDRWGVGFSLRVPRPRHPKAAVPEQQRGWV